MVKNLKLLDKALQLLPEVKETVVEPLDIAAFLKPLKKGDSVEIDFGRHLVGHIKLKFQAFGEHHFSALPHTRNSQRPVILSRRTDRHKAFPLDHYLCSWPYAGNLSFCLKRQRIKQSGLHICHSDVCRHDRPVHLRIFLLPLPQ